MGLIEGIAERDLSVALIDDAQGGTRLRGVGAEIAAIDEEDGLLAVATPEPLRVPTSTPRVWLG